MKKILFLTVLISFFTCAIVLAEEITSAPQVPTIETNTAPATSSSPRFNIGAGYWWTLGRLDTELIADQDYFPLILKGDKISELNYDTNAGLFIVNADAYLFWRLHADAFIGFGNMHDASQTDSDWIWQITTDKWFESKASADGDVRTWNLNAYLRIIEEPEDKGFLDLGIGYLYYKDNVSSINDLLYRIEWWEPVYDPIAGLDSSDKYTFDGIRFSARARIRLIERIAIVGGIGIVPWMNGKRDGYWNLRESPNTPGLLGMKIRGDADGTAVDFNIGIEFKVTRNLFVEAGYKYMDFDTDKGDYSHSWSDGSKYSFKDAWGSTEARRSGIYGLAKLKF